MSDTTEKLRQELQAARRAVAELQARLENSEAGYRLTTLELEENRSALLFMLEDLEAGRKKIEQAHQEWVSALDVVDDPIFLHDKELRVLRCNKAYQRCAGIPFDQIIGRLYYEVFPKTGTPLPCCLRALEKAEEEEEEEEVAVGDAIYRSRAFSIKDEQGAYLYSVHTLEDITESRRAVAALHESEEIFRYFMEFSPIYIFFKDRNIRSIRLSRNYEKMLGKPLEELLGKSMNEMFPSDLARSMVEDDMRIMREGRSITVDETLDGKYYTTIKFPILIDGDPRYLAGYTIDITARKEAEIALKHANRALATLSEVNRSLVYATDENDLLQAICRTIVEQRGYRLAWVGYKQYDENKSIKVLASAGHDEGYLDAMQLTWAETGRGMGSGGRAVRSGVTQLCQDIANDPLCLPWCDGSRQHGYASCIVLPLLDGDNAVFGILTVYAAEANTFIPAEVALLEEMAEDLAFGVRTLHTRRERDLALKQNRRQLEQLESNLEDTVRAIATIVEMRDPYTAGHQARVADLAAAIAGQMGLPDDRVHSIRLAGVVHDLGKVQIPAEILSKPGRLSVIEYSLIQTHAQAGYDILKGINFPWPIAQMVLQHHERLDGSGYPQGLKGDAILLEARILSVADVVESMFSHRPYRPGMGMEVALEEIAKNSGTLYEPQVVDACLALFREQGYRFA